MNLKQQLMLQRQYTAQGAGKTAPKEPKAKPAQIGAKEAIEAELTAMGVDFDGRWGVKRLKRALDEAKAGQHEA